MYQNLHLWLFNDVEEHDLNSKICRLSLRFNNALTTAWTDKTDLNKVSITTQHYHFDSIVLFICKKK